MQNSIVFQGVRFTRYPESQERTSRVYYRHGNTLLHRAIWEAAHGPIPDGHHIHHRDGDPLNNALENLECVSTKQHAEHHAEEHREARRAHAERIRPLAAEWHSSPEGVAWHREHGRRSWEDREPELITCENCGEQAERHSTGGSVRYCSRGCSRAVRDRERRYEQEVPCPMCGTTFWQNKHKLLPKTCSRSCGQSLRRSSS